MKVNVGVSDGVSVGVKVWVGRGVRVGVLGEMVIFKEGKRSSLQCAGRDMTTKKQ